MRVKVKFFVLVLAICLAQAFLLNFESVPANATPDPEYVSRATIFIEGDDNFTAANGVVAGSGTAEDPYVIENWAIDASGAHGIHIKNTTSYFVVRNCLVENGSYFYNGIFYEGPALTSVFSLPPPLLISFYDPDGILLLAV